MVAAPFVSELRIFAFGFAPKGWVPCNGQLLPVKEYQLLFTLLGTTYGGDGVNTFGVPNLNARVPMHRRFDFPIGAMGGEDAHTLILDEIPNHSHQAVASSNTPDSNTAENNFWAYNTAFNPYGSEADNPPMSSEALQQVGENLPHDNMAPYLVFNICMAVVGIYPEPNNAKSISDPWMGELRIFASSVVPHYWYSCDGQTLPVSSNSGLFMILGKTYGGNGLNNFGLPNLQASAPIMGGQGKGLQPYDLGESGGVNTVTLSANETPLHTHAAYATAEGTEGEPTNHIWANPASVRPFPNYYATSAGPSLLNMNPAAIGSVGGGKAHNNLMPYTVLNFCITSYGDIPSRP